MNDTSVARTSTGMRTDHEILDRWIRCAVARGRLHARLRAARRAAVGLLALAIAWSSLALLGVPEAVSGALAPLFALGGLTVVALAVRCGLRAGDVRDVVAEADARAAMNDALRSAHWFMQQEVASSWHAVLLGRAARKVQAHPVHTIFPLGVAGSILAAAALAAVIASAHFFAAPGAPISAAQTAPAALRARPSPGIGGQAAPDAIASDAAVRTDGKQVRAGGGMAEGAWRQPVQASAPDSVAAAPSAQSGDGAAAAAPAANVPGAALHSVSAADSLARTLGLAQGVVQGLLDRLSATVGRGSGATPQETAGGAQAEAAAGAPSQPAQGREQETLVTMEQLGEALRALAQAPTGDSATPASPPSADGSSGSTRGNIKGGAMGVRVNTSELGEGGDGAPPDWSGESPDVPLFGRATARRPAQLRGLASDALPQAGSSAPDGFYVATQAQAAGVALTTIAPVPQAAGERAAMRGEVPLAYRAAVRRYFLTEHGKAQ